MREYSVKKMTIIVFLFIIGIMFFGFYYFQIISKRNLDNYKRFVEINKNANELIFLINDGEIMINTFFNTKDEVTYKKYKEVGEDVNIRLDALENFSKKEKEIVAYLRNSEDTGYYQEVLYYLRLIRNMNNYQLELAEDIYQKQISGLDTRDQVLFLNRYFNEMDVNAKLLIQVYFNFTGTIFDEYYEENKKLGKDISTIVFFLASIGFVLIITYLYGFLKVINQFEYMSKALSNHEWEVKDIKKGRYREFNKISETFNGMKGAIINYIEEIQEKSKLEIQLKSEKLMRVEKEKLLNETRLLSLQMKMNPHFLFNTLNLIGTTAIHSDIEMATELIEAISDILRYNLEFDKKRVELKREIDILEKYVFIQKARWQDRIKFVITNKVEDSDIKIPPMLIQPLIENSIIHGMKNVVESGVIFIEFFEKNEDLIVTVFDNGTGIEPERIEQIYSDEPDKNSEKKRDSIGLKNIRKRLEMIYKQKNLLKIERLKSGTLIKLIFPKERNQEDD